MSKYSCPCCGYLVYEENPSGSYEVCPVCYWEYDDFQNENENYIGGANGLSLKQARINFRNFGAIQEKFRKFTRLPNLLEQPN